jgi:hypothetical protein
MSNDPARPGGYVAGALALRRLTERGAVPLEVVKPPIAAVSVGVVCGAARRLRCCWLQWGSCCPAVGGASGAASRGEHCGWSNIRPVIHIALNTVSGETHGKVAIYLKFGI